MPADAEMFRNLLATLAPAPDWAGPRGQVMSTLCDAIYEGICEPGGGVRVFVGRDESFLADVAWRVREVCRHVGVPLLPLNPHVLTLALLMRIADLDDA